MNRFALQSLNLSLHVFHQVWILFHLVGWMFCQTRLLHLVVVGLTLSSWYCLGPLTKKGNALGYCVVTDIQWGVRKRLGLESRDGGYVKYLGDHLFGHNFDESLADKIGAGIFFVCIAASLTTLYWYGSCPLLAD